MTSHNRIEQFPVGTKVLAAMHMASSASKECQCSYCRFYRREITAVVAALPSGSTMAAVPPGGISVKVRFGETSSWIAVTDLELIRRRNRDR